MIEQTNLRRNAMLGVDDIERPGTFGLDAVSSMLRFAVEVCALCIPAWINRNPLVYPDTRAYYQGGLAAIEKIASVVEHHNDGGGGELLSATIQKARGVRSAFYSLFVYLPTDIISIWAVVVMQAIIVAALLRLAFRMASHPELNRSHRTHFIILLSALTTVSWATSNVMPDIFTSIMALGIMITLVYWECLTVWLKVGLFITISGGVVMHIMNLPIAIGMLVVGSFLVHRRARGGLPRYGMAIGAIALSIMAMLTVGVVGFKEWTLAPQSPPFLTARSIEDGPGKLYLRDHCPQINLAMCHHLDKLDQNTEIFIWDKAGVYSAVPADEEAQLRAEDKRLFVKAAFEHPWMEAKAMAQHALVQLITFSLHEYYIPSWAEYTATNMTLHMPDQAPWQTYLSIVEYSVVIASLIFIVYAWKRVSDDQRQFTVLAISAVLLEAFAGAISEAVPRYEARVIWLIPMCALLFTYQVYSRRQI